MDKDPNMVKQLTMYSNDAVEAMFTDGTKIFLAPCATEYVVQQNNHAQGVMTTKHRTIYTTSTILPRLRSIIAFRNLYAQQPFLVPSLVDSNQCYQSTGTATHIRWSPNISLPSILHDDPSQTWCWTSVCGRARIEIPHCRQVVYITHPLQVSRVLTQPANDAEIPTKYIHVYAPVRRCFSCQRLPAYVSKFVQQCLQLIERLSDDSNVVGISGDDDDDEWSFELPLALPSSSCPNVHRHRLHHEMMFEADIHILQTTPALTYRLEYDHPTSIEALVIDEEKQVLVDYVITRDIQSSFYNYYSMKEQQCHLLTLSEHALPPHNDRLVQIIRFMSTMRQRLLSMARRVQERPCWSHDDATCESHTIEHTSTLDDPDENESIYRQTSIVDVGCFKYFLDDRVHIQFSNGFLVEMTPDQVHSCQLNPYENFRCRITDRRKHTTIDIFDGSSPSQCYQQYITATMDWCLWIWDEKRREDQHNLAANIQEELFRLKLYRNRMEISDYQQSPILTSTVTHPTDYYSPDDIRQILDRTARFTGTSSS